MDIRSKHIAAVCAGNAGLNFTRKEIEVAIVSMFPGTNRGSLNISDYAPSDKQGSQYADHLYDRVSGGYRVRAESERKSKPVNVRSANVSDAEALAAFEAKKLAAKTAQAQANPTPASNPSKPAVVVPAAVVQGNKPNGQAQPSATK